MVYLTLRREIGKMRYIARMGNNISADILGLFLQEIGNDTGWYREWAKDPNQEETGNNATLLEKEDGKVIMQTEWACKETDPSFITTIDNFISILSQWEKLYAQLPNEIVVYKEGEDFILKGRD